MTSPEDKGRRRIRLTNPGYNPEPREAEQMSPEVEAEWKSTIAQLKSPQVNPNHPEE